MDALITKYMMIDARGRQVGNIEESYVPLVEMARCLNEDNDMVIWEIDPEGVHRIIGITTKHNADKVKRFMI